MMKNIYLLTLSAILFALHGFSMPARKGTRIYTQPDGSIITYRVVGNESFHFATTEGGMLIALDDDGYFREAEIATDGAIVPIKGTNPNNASLRAAEIDKEAIRIKGKRRAPQTGLGLSTTAYPTVGNPKGLIILVEYKDVKFKDSYEISAQDYFNDMINGEHFSQEGGTGSALQYFKDQSGGKFTPDFDVLGPVTLPHEMAFYGKNDRFGEDENAHLMVTHAIEILDKDIDFSVYDTDGDGEIDNVYVFYAGEGEASYGSVNSVWPHSWDVRLAGVNMVVDGVEVGLYACSNEWEETMPCGVGSFIHEFSHVLGLPDLYHTMSATAKYTPDEYSVLDYGPYNNDGRTPPNYGAYEKNALGWFEPIMLDTGGSLILEDISTGQFGLIPTTKDSEFFLIENRQLIGWDKYIPNHGMLIWHIDYVESVFDNNIVNNNKNHQYVDLVEANDIQDFDYSEGWTFPGTTGKTSFTAETVPALKSWGGQAIDLPLTNISESEGKIFFNIAGGGQPLSVKNPMAIEGSDKTVFFNLQGIQIENPLPGQIVIERNEGKTIKRIIR